MSKTPAVAKKTTAPARRTITEPAERIAPASTINTVATALPPEKIIVGTGHDEKTVRVHVPKPFRLMDDHRHIHVYDKIGEQEMPVSHANAEYAKDNGVKVLDDQDDQDD